MVIPRSRSAFSLSSTQAVKRVISWMLQTGPYLLTIFEGAFAELSSFLLEFFNGTLIDTTTLVDQVTSSGRLAGVDVADN